MPGSRIKYLGAPQEVEIFILTTDDQYLAIGKKECRMSPAADIQRTHRGPISIGSALGIEQKRALRNMGHAETAGDQHSAVRE